MKKPNILNKYSLGGAAAGGAVGTGIGALVDYLWDSEVGWTGPIAGGLSGLMLGGLGGYAYSEKVQDKKEAEQRKQQEAYREEQVRKSEEIRDRGKLLRAKLKLTPNMSYADVMKTAIGPKKYKEELEKAQAVRKNEPGFEMLASLNPEILNKKISISTERLKDKGGYYDRARNIIKYDRGIPRTDLSVIIHEALHGTQRKPTTKESQEYRARGPKQNALYSREQEATMAQYNALLHMKNMPKNKNTLWYITDKLLSDKTGNKENKTRRKALEKRYPGIQDVLDNFSALRLVTRPPEVPEGYIKYMREYIDKGKTPEERRDRKEKLQNKLIEIGRRLVEVMSNNTNQRIV